MANRVQTFWREISDGIAVQQLWSQFHHEARASYRLYSKEVDWKRGEQERRVKDSSAWSAGFFGRWF